jgi:tetratricopeptide (TPR) repeat protein
MGKFYVPFTTTTPGERVREALERAENLVTNLEGAGTEALQLLHNLDYVSDQLDHLRETSDIDLRAEATLFETIQRQLDRRGGRFLAEVGDALYEERNAVQPAEDHWWWFIDEVIADRRKSRLQRVFTRVGIAVAVLLIGWLAYEQFLAPAPNVREAMRASASAEMLVQEGDLEAALEEFETAVALHPEDADSWVWIGVLRQELDQSEQAEEAFQRAQELSKDMVLFLRARARVYMFIGDLEAAEADANRAVEMNPESGHGYLIRANVAAEQGRFDEALEDLERADQLAREAGDVRLEALARTQRAMMMQRQLYSGASEPTATPEE